MKKNRGGRAPKCFCGCGAEVNHNRRFKPGHDARFHGRAKKVARGELTATEATAGMTDRAKTAFREEVAVAKAVVPAVAPATEQAVVPAAEQAVEAAAVA